MQRLPSAPRADWREKFEALGFSFHSADGGYWDESACYRFSAEQVDRLEEVTAEMHRLCLAAADAAGKISWGVSVDATITRAHQHACNTTRPEQDTGGRSESQAAR